MKLASPTYLDKLVVLLAGEVGLLGLVVLTSDDHGDPGHPAAPAHTHDVHCDPGLKIRNDSRIVCDDIQFLTSRDSELTDLTP